MFAMNTQSSTVRIAAINMQDAVNKGTGAPKTATQKSIDDKTLKYACNRRLAGAKSNSQWGITL